MARWPGRSSVIDVASFGSAAYEQGKLARRNGEPVERNPQHPFAPLMRAQWERGWRDEDARLKALVEVPPCA